MKLAAEIYAKMRTEPGMLAELSTIKEMDALTAKIGEYAKGLGKDVSREEIREALTDVSGLITATVGEDELTDDELELVGLGAFNIGDVKIYGGKITNCNDT